VDEVLHRQHIIVTNRAVHTQQTNVGFGLNDAFEKRSRTNRTKTAILEIDIRHTLTVDGALSDWTKNFIGASYTCQRENFYSVSRIQEKLPGIRGLEGPGTPDQLSPILSHESWKPDCAELNTSGHHHSRTVVQF
jgi:hypothetical protein